MEPAQIVKVNGNEYTLIIDGKEHTLILPGELPETFGRVAASTDTAGTSYVSHTQSQSPGRHIPTSSTAGSSTVWNQDLSNWTPKLGTDLDSKWLQRIGTDYTTSQPSPKAEVVQPKQAVSMAKVQNIGSSYVPVQFDGKITIPIFTKVDPITSKADPDMLAFRLAAAGAKPVTQTLVTAKPIAKQVTSNNKTAILMSKENAGNRQTSTVEHLGPHTVMENLETGNLSTISQNNDTEKIADQQKAQFGYSIIYRSKLEKAIEQNNLNIVKSQNPSVTAERSSSQGTLKRLLNSGEYRSPMIVQSPNSSQTGIKFDEKSLKPVRDADEFLMDNRSEKSGEDSEVYTSDEMIKKKFSKGKTLDQNNSTAVADFYKKYVNSEQVHSKNMVAKPSTMTLESHGTVKNIASKEADTARQTQSTVGLTQTSDTSLLTTLAQSNTAPVTVATGHVGKYLFNKGKDQNGWGNTQGMEKEYIDNSLARDILDRLWELREKELFCDAVIFMGETQVKLHKLVLAGVSPEMNKKVVESKDIELMFLLPDGITYDHTLLFISYLYRGRLKLTVDNVQALYRLSGLFHLEQLKKHCYDFCRLTKMGHLIISSPYQEAAKQVAEVPKSITQQKTSKTPAKAKAGNQMVKSQIVEPEPPAGNNNKPTLTAKSVTKKEVKAAEFDWMNSDPSQSNIPIRKRGRTRKGLTSSANTTVTQTLLDISSEKSSTMESDGTAVLKSMNKATNDTTVTSTKAISESKTEPTKVKTSDIPKKKKNIQVSPIVKETSSVGKDIEQLNILPDPLATGKFDESELLKIVPSQEEFGRKTRNCQVSVKPQFGKTMVTRFRNRPKTMSVMEAASQKKAKSNDTSSVFTSKIKSKGKGKKQVTGKSPRSAEKSKTESVAGNDMAVNKSNYHYTLPDKSVVDVGKGKTKASDKSGSPEMVRSNAQTMKAKSVKDILPKFYSETINTHSDNITESQIETVSQEQKAGSSAVSDRETTEEGSLKRKTPGAVLADGVVKPVESSEHTIQTASSQEVHTASPPKKARQRKATLELQESPKDTVYMRPPPKKRTKEIREMMKNEDAVLEVAKNIAASDQIVAIPETSLKIEANKPEQSVTNIEDKKPITKKSKKTPVKDDSLMQQVYDIELSGKGIDGEKQYRCNLCNNVFIYARRVVTHLVNTHDIAIENASPDVTVEPRSACPKICDICGYQTKEVNIYYIHYHRYFRHGVPLPKGWQPFTCDLCKKEFFTKFQLREHKLIHFEDNPFVCEHCGSGFKSRTCLNSHVFHKHSSVRRHSCSVCPKTFKTRTQLKVHKRTHTGDKPFGCPDPQCQYRSTTRGNMRLHLVNRHKFSNEHTKDMMNALQPSVDPAIQQANGGEEPGWIDSSQESERDLNEDRAVEMASDPATLTTLVEAAVAEVNGTGNYTVQNLNEANNGQDQGMGPVLSNVETMATQLINQDHVMNPANRDYDMTMVHPVQIVQNMSIVNQSGQSENLAGHVPIMVQSSMDMQQHSGGILVQQHEQNTEALQNYHQNPGEHTLTTIQLQEYRDHDLPMASQAYSISQETRLEVSNQIPHKSRLDPHSREARMIMKEALQGNEPRSLLKAAILQDTMDSTRLLRVNSESAKFTMDTRQDITNHLPQSDSQFLDENVLVIDTQAHQDPQLVIDEDHKIHSIRVHEQFRGGHSNAVFREDNDGSLPSPQHHQDLDQGHLQSFQTSMAPPPSYSGPTQGLMATVPVTDISVSHSGLTLTSDNQGQYQTEAGQSLPVQPGPGYSSNPSQSQPGAQLNSDGTVYVGYYQQQFPIENY